VLLNGVFLSDVQMFYPNDPNPSKSEKSYFGNLCMCVLCTCVQLHVYMCVCACVHACVCVYTCMCTCRVCCETDSFHLPGARDIKSLREAIVDHVESVAKRPHDWPNFQPLVYVTE